MSNRHSILTFVLLAGLFGAANAQTLYKVLPSIYAIDNAKRVHDDTAHVLKGIVLDTNRKPVDQVFIFLSFKTKGNPDIEWIGTGAFHADEKGEFNIAVADSMKDKDIKLIFVASGYENQELNFTMDELPCYQYLQMKEIHITVSQINEVACTLGCLAYFDDNQKSLDLIKTEMGFKTFKPIEDRIVDIPLPPPSFIGPRDKR
jgi:hypothetical protein